MYPHWLVLVLFPPDLTPSPLSGVPSAPIHWVHGPRPGLPLLSPGPPTVKRLWAASGSTGGTITEDEQGALGAVRVWWLAPGLVLNFILGWSLVHIRAAPALCLHGLAGWRGGRDDALGFPQGGYLTARASGSAQCCLAFP